MSGTKTRYFATPEAVATASTLEQVKVYSWMTEISHETWLKVWKARNRKKIAAILKKGALAR